MAHKQLFGLKDQLGLVNYQLGEVTKLEAEAPKAGENAPFPVVMSATVIGLSLKKARELLEEAQGILQGEISFYETCGDDFSSPAREGLTAGQAAYCMQSVAAATVYMLKGMEKARSYRS